MGPALLACVVHAVPALSLALNGICCDEGQILQISKRFSQMAGEESRDHARTVGWLLQEELSATEHHLARIGR